MSDGIFRLKSKFKPTGDQPEAIEKLYKGLKRGDDRLVLQGVTGSGKTFTMANLIAKGTVRRSSSRTTRPSPPSSSRS